jgi:hypothetical protein
VIDYATILRTRARFAREYAPAEIARETDQRNVANLLAWIARWYERCPRPDAWSGYERGFFDLSLAQKRLAARDWLRARRHTGNTNVMPIHSRRSTQ